ncbi:beta-ketoacyl-[acyl-carrier-protein] synthase family protein [Cellulomonas edaphi]|uniref:Beta-ketoacyl synthase N-terminal domain-containing protein n=1 Tax=Cellulomonas edaphi TaxID=3053468 RepID=A0ABT7S4T5_9CELL|nr:hypothetical protein [Cellulomons edaphi]MDM7830625.1 hypothetical protein [Cellulomons edaphi]
MSEVVSPPLVAAGDAVSAWAAATLLDLWGPDAGFDALYVATSEAGAGEALAFWAAARTTGFALAAPGAFPYTLANAPAGRIGTALGIRGPSVTLLGSLAEALEVAGEDRADGLADRALVVHLDPVVAAATAAPPATRWRLVDRVVASPPSADARPDVAAAAGR